MPFTPFHFGAGAAIHAIAPRRISFLALCAVNVVIDFETLYYMVNHNPPLHRFLHTFVGTHLAIIATIMLFVAGRWFASKYWLPNWFRWRDLTLTAVTFGAIIGAWSHVVLDGIMHADTRPFSPFSQRNPMYGVIDISLLHQLCLVLGALGFAVVGVRSLMLRGNRIR